MFRILGVDIQSFKRNSEENFAKIMEPIFMICMGSLFSRESYAAWWTAADILF